MHRRERGETERRKNRQERKSFGREEREREREKIKETEIIDIKR